MDFISVGIYRRAISLFADGQRQGQYRGGSTRSLIAILILAMLSGCSQDPGRKATAAVSGEVTFEGKPVTGGMLTFAPMSDESSQLAGRAGQAVIGGDGSFNVTTYADGDGAVVGTHRLIYAAPTAEVQETPAGAHAIPQVSPYAGLSPKEVEVEVSPGGNTIDIELVKLPPLVKKSDPGPAAHAQAAHGQAR